MPPRLPHGITVLTGACECRFYIFTPYLNKHERIHTRGLALAIAAEVPPVPRSKSPLLLLFLGACTLQSVAEDGLGLTCCLSGGRKG